MAETKKKSTTKKKAILKPKAIKVPNPTTTTKKKKKSPEEATAGLSIAQRKLVEAREKLVDPDTIQARLTSENPKTLVKLFRENIEVYFSHVLGVDTRDPQQMKLIWSICNLVNAKEKVAKKKILHERIMKLSEFQGKRTVKSIKVQNELDELKKEQLSIVVSEEEKELAGKIGISVDSGRGTGKCLGWEEDILLANGEYVKANTLIGMKKDVLSLKDGKTCNVQGIFFDNGIRDVYKIKFRSGREIERTGCHPLRKIDRWQKCKDISIGDRVVCPSKIDIRYNNAKSYTVEELKLLGYLIGDGCLTNKSNVLFSQEDNKQLKEFINCVEVIGDSVIKRNKYDYCVLNGKTGNVKKLVKNNGLFLSNSHTKRVPKEVFSSNIEDIAIFLSRYYSCDGWAYTKKTKIGKHVIEIGCCSVSMGLLIDIQRLLLRFGILASIRSKKTSWTYNGIKKRSVAYCLEIRESDDIIKFCNSIGIYGKEESIERCLETAKSRQSNTSTWAGIYPKEVFDYISLDKKTLRHKHDLRKSNQCGIRIKKLTEIKDYISNSFIRDCIDNKFVFDEVVSIEYLGKQQTVGITVPETQTFISDFYEHNTYALAGAIIWFLTNFPSIVIATAPKQDLLRDNLWGKMHDIKRRSIEKNGEGSTLDRMIEIMADRVSIVDNKDNFCVARTASRNANESDQKATLSGYHATYMMIVVDESYGVPNTVYEPLDDTLSQPVNLIVLIGNPTKNHGFAADTWGKHKKYWVNLRMNAEDSVFVDDGHIARLKDKYADDPNGYRINVLGLKPVDDVNALIPYSAITKCIDLVLPESSYKNEPCVFGCDIGGGSDLTVVIKRQGQHIEVIGTYNSRDTFEIAEWIGNLIETYDPIKVGVDGIGIGAGTYNDLCHMGYRSITTFVDSRARSINKEKFKNKRAELYWGIREKLIKGELSIPDHEALKSELSILKLVNEEFNKQIQIISKSELKKEGQKSPNFADALMITEAFGRQRVRAMSRSHESRISRLERLDTGGSFMGC